MMEAEERAQMRQDMREQQACKDAARLRGQLGFSMYIIAVLCPLAGFIWMVVLLLRDELSDRLMGACMCATTATGTFLWWLMWKAWGIQTLARAIHDLGAAVAKVTMG